MSYDYGVCQIFMWDVDYVWVYKFSDKNSNTGMRGHTVLLPVTDHPFIRNPAIALDEATKPTYVESVTYGGKRVCYNIEPLGYPSRKLGLKVYIDKPLLNAMQQRYPTPEIWNDSEYLGYLTPQYTMLTERIMQNIFPNGLSDGAVGTVVLNTTKNSDPYYVLGHDIASAEFDKPVLVKITKKAYPDRSLMCFCLHALSSTDPENGSGYWTPGWNKFAPVYLYDWGPSGPPSDIKPTTFGYYMGDDPLKDTIPTTFDNVILEKYKKKNSTFLGWSLTRRLDKLITEDTVVPTTKKCIHLWGVWDDDVKDMTVEVSMLPQTAPINASTIKKAKYSCSSLTRDIPSILDPDELPNYGSDLVFCGTSPVEGTTTWEEGIYRQSPPDVLLAYTGDYTMPTRAKYKPDYKKNKIGFLAPMVIFTKPPERAGNYAIFINGESSVEVYLVDIDEKFPHESDWEDWLSGFVQDSPIYVGAPYNFYGLPAKYIYNYENIPNDIYGDAVILVKKKPPIGYEKPETGMKADIMPILFEFSSRKTSHPSISHYNRYIKA